MSTPYWTLLQCFGDFKCGLLNIWGMFVWNYCKVNFDRWIMINRDTSRKKMVRKLIEFWLWVINEKTLGTKTFKFSKDMRRSFETFPDHTNKAILCSSKRRKLPIAENFWFSKLNLYLQGWYRHLKKSEWMAIYGGSNRNRWAVLSFCFFFSK